MKPNVSASLKFTPHQIASLILSNPDGNGPFLLKHSLKRAGENLIEAKKRKKAAQFGANHIIGHVAVGGEWTAELSTSLLDFVAMGAKVKPI